MILGVSYWAWIGTIYLILLAYQDIKNNCNVDDRKNAFMLGATLALLSHLDRSLLIILVFLFIVWALKWYLDKTEILGEADNNTLIWLFYGYAILNPGFLLFYAGFFIIITLLYTFLKNKVYQAKVLPFYPVILLSFIITNVILGLY